MVNHAGAEMNIPVKVEQLGGDASIRQFSRFTYNDGSTAIRMLTPAEVSADFKRYLDVQKFLIANGLPVPEILSIIPDNLEIIIQDLGDTDYFYLHERLNPNRQAEYYEKFIDLILDIGHLHQKFNSDYTGLKEILGFERLKWELEFFLTNFDRLCTQNFIGSPEQIILTRWLENIAQGIDQYPRTLCHRDFHSKNIMIYDQKPYLVDFQDLRIGPFNYDLVSLIWDSYLKPDDSIIELMQKRFFEGLWRLDINIDWAKYLEYNRYTAVQRNIKAIGTFSSQANLGNKRYLQFIKPTVAKIATHLSLLGISDEGSKILIALLERFKI